MNLLGNLARNGLHIGLTLDELHWLKEGAVARARAAGFRRRLQTTLASLAFALVRRGDIDASAPMVAELLALELPDDPPGVRAPRMIVQTIIHEQRSEFEQAIASLEEQRIVLQGEPELITCEMNLAMFLNDVGRHSEAADIGLALLARRDIPRHHVGVCCNTAYALVALGRAEEARTVLRAYRGELAASPVGMSSAEALALLCLADGRLADAVRIDAVLESYGRRTGNLSNTLTGEFRRRLERELDAAGIDAAEIAHWRLEGAALSDADAVELALR